MSSQRVLVVDDEKSIREFLTILLQQENYEVVTAASVGEGKDRLAKDRPNLVMCDLKLPDGTGLEVLQHARDQNLATPFIIITAHTTPQHALEAMRAGAAEYLSNPSMSTISRPSSPNFCRHLAWIPDPSKSPTSSVRAHRSDESST